MRPIWLRSNLLTSRLAAVLAVWRFVSFFSGIQLPLPVTF